MKTRTLLKASAALVAATTIGLAISTSARSEQGGGYRTAIVGRHAVDQVLATVGTIEPVAQAAVSFPVGGTVASVDVRVGDTVVVGRRLASLEVGDLEAARTSARASLDQANLVLQLALDGEDLSGVTGGAPSGGFGRPSSVEDTSLRDAMAAVVAAQASVTDALAAAEAAAANAEDVCSADVEGTTSCQAALAASLEAQRTLAQAQSDLVAATSDLTDLLEALAEEATTATTTTTTTTAPTDPGTPTPSVPGASTPTAPPSGGSDPTASAGNGPSSPASASPSAEDLIAYQKAVDAAELSVVVAEQELAQATIVSPVAGTVVAVELEAGDEVTAASATQHIVVVADGGFEVTTKVSVDDLTDLEVGQAATVAPDGVDDPIAGEVVRIAVAPDTSDGANTYAVTIGLTGDTSTLGNGSTAAVEIVTAASTDAIAVATSAVTVDGQAATVQLLVDGKPEVTEVTIGAIGTTWTEVTEGLEEGDVVVLADLDEPLPGSATESTSQGSQGAITGFPGGLPGGFRGGP